MMINVKGNLINEKKVLSVKPYKVKDRFDNRTGWVYKTLLEITFIGGIITNIEAKLGQYNNAVKEANND